MSESFTVHPGAEDLMRLVAGELAPEHERAMRQHVGSCAACREALERVETAWSEYREYHEKRLKPSIPAPPRPWTVPEVLLAPTSRRRLVRPILPWAAVAAALLLAVLGYERFRRPPVVSAAELLRKATAAEEKRPRAGRIRIRTRTSSMVRPVLAGSGRRAASDAAFEHELQARFAGAHYSWEDPLGAGTFSRWRNQLPEKRDEVSQITDQTTRQSLYRIRTTTGWGPLVEATLSLRTADLHPVEGELKFRDETVLITELPEMDPVPAPPISEAPPPAPAAEPQPPAVGPSEELRTLAALHEIGADLGEPIEVTRNPHEVVVAASGLTPAREREVREAVAAIPGAVVRSEDSRPDAGRRPQSPAAARTPVDELANQILEASDAALARAFALDALAERFPAEVASKLPPADRALLAEMRSEHLGALTTAAGRVEALLKATWPETAAAPAQPETGPILDAARHLDQLLNRAFAGGAGPARAEVLAALRTLQARAARGLQ